ncbi:MAG: L-threonylcarbamoyladenylate synthase [Pseudomonadota bacterium]|nr:L-threonylcarbamoyladenylate synthase [Pseudomonadota bacterium]
MKNIYSNIYSFNKKTLRKTIKLLNQGNLVGLPTETVYGLAGNAYLKKAIKKIFDFKNRPKMNPLIIHYYKLEDAKKDIILTNSFLKLYKKFCPGPLTFVLNKKKSSKIQPLSNANLETIAIRFPNHKVVRSVLRLTNYPLAMPSANISSKISPVTAKDVYEDFKKKLKIIIDGGNSKIGIESTVIDLTGKPKILRPGIVGQDEIKRILKKNFSNKKTNVRSPGMLRKHYSPGIPIVVGKRPLNKNHAYIFMGKKFSKRKNYFNLSKKANLKEAAANLYTIMRKIKKMGFKKIFVSKIPKIGPGIAINDRLTRASK